MHIEHRGSGPDLVMIHGWAMHSGVFAPLIEALAEHYCLHLVDLPGHGRSPRTSAGFTLEGCAREIALATPPAVWLGWSLGGAVALCAAADQPAQVRGLIMIASSPSFVIRNDWPHAVDHSVFAQFAEELGRDWAATLRRFLALEVQGSDHAREELRVLRDALLNNEPPSLQALRDGLDILDHSDQRGELTGLDTAALWIAGSRDRLVPWQAMEAAAAMQGSARFCRIPGAGHAPFLGHCEQIATLIRQFMGEHA